MAARLQLPGRNLLCTPKNKPNFQYQLARPVPHLWKPSWILDESANMMLNTFLIVQPQMSYLYLNMTDVILVT